MTAPDLARALSAEAIGTAVLVCAGIGSGIMADQLTDDQALALMCVAVPTGAMLFVLITLFLPLSGGHLNPAVSLVMALRGALRPGVAAGYVAAQVAGGLAGVTTAHAMFGLPLVQTAGTLRSGAPLWLAEGIATAGLIATILCALRAKPQALAQLVALYITAAFWFTASSSFANPAVTIARAFSDTYTGIRPQDAPGYVLAQMAGALLALALCGWLYPDRRRR